ncbi:MAG: DUF5666 domain-containing protein [Burkholderiaceae bacterium]
MKSRSVPESFLAHFGLSALSAALLFGLAACGGGDPSPAAEQTLANTAPDGRQSALQVSGTVTGLGRLAVDGVRYDTAGATVRTEADPSAPAVTTASALQLGQRVTLQASNGQATEVVIQPSLFGPVGAVHLDARSFTVYGQAVVVRTEGEGRTVFAGASGLAALAVGDAVEVHGNLQADKSLLATRVERKAKTELGKGVKVGGRIAALNLDTRRFKFNDMTVDFSAATVLPLGATPQAGQLALVYSRTLPGAAGLKADTLKLVTPADGGGFVLGGGVTAFASVANFTVSGIQVDASQARVSGSGAVGLGAVVSLEGTVVDGVLKAATMTIVKPAPVTEVPMTVEGTIGDWVSGAKFKVQGQWVDASAASFSGGVAADLGNGARVVVAGVVKGELLKARTVTFKAPPVAQTVKLMGEVRDYDAAAGRFEFLGVTLKLADGVGFVDGTRDTLANGKRVQVTGVADKAGIVWVSRVDFLPDLARQAAVVGGRVGDLAAGGFKLPGMAVSFNDDTVFEGGGRADLANGLLVLAKGKYNAATKTVAATWIELITEDAYLPRVAGGIGEYHSPANFKIGPQRIDASKAVFIHGTAEDLAVGVLVEVVGQLVTVDGVRVLQASKLRCLTE